MGWRARASTSMMASLRLASQAPSVCRQPASSGPRWPMRSRAAAPRVSLGRSRPMTEAIPHLPLEGDRVRAYTDVALAILTEMDGWSASTRYRALQHVPRLRSLLGQVTVSTAGDTIGRPPGRRGQIRYFATHAVR